MNSWWQGREPRERLLLTIAAMLAVIALIVQFIAVPSLQNRDRAALAVDKSASTLVRLEKLVERRAVYRPAAPQLSFQDASAEASRWATDAGLAHQQEIGADGQARFVFAPAEPTRIFAWVERVETELALSISSAEMTSAELGLIQATLVVSEGAAS